MLLFVKHRQSFSLYILSQLLGPIIRSSVAHGASAWRKGFNLFMAQMLP